jgi:hypothetical protein
VTRRRKTAVAVGIFIGFVSAVFLGIKVLPGTTRGFDERAMMAISIGVAWAGLFGAVGGLLGARVMK